MRRYYAMLCEHGSTDAVGKMKQFATYFTHGVRNGSRLRADIYHAVDDRRRFSDLVDAFFERELCGVTLASWSGLDLRTSIEHP